VQEAFHLPLALVCKEAVTHSDGSDVTILIPGTTAQNGHNAERAGLRGQAHRDYMFELPQDLAPKSKRCQDFVPDLQNLRRKQRGPHNFKQSTNRRVNLGTYDSCSSLFFIRWLLATYIA
jgi:hypothetical protein